jgi:hypothetical protein
MPVGDGALIGALGLERKVAFGAAHRVIRRPDTATALIARRACGELKAA